MPTFADDIRELARRMTDIETRTDKRHEENQASTQQLSEYVRDMRSVVDRQAIDSGHFRDEALARWQRADRNQGIFERFIDDWEGRPQEGKIGLAVQLRTMLGEWGRLRWGARVVWAAMAISASAIGYLAAHFLESHK